MNSKNYFQKFKDKIDSSKQDEVFVLSDFFGITEPGNACVYLRRLEKIGQLRRIMRGVYVKPVCTKPGADKIARAITRNYGWNIVPSGDTALFMSGMTRNEPKKWIYKSDSAYKKYTVNGIEIIFKHTNSINEISGVSEQTALYIQVLRAYGKKNINNYVINRLAKNVKMKNKRKLIYETERITVWLRNILIKICEASSKYTYHKPFNEWDVFPEKKKIMTPFGFKVRTKSEAMIIAQLHMAGLEYKYEKVLTDKYDLPYWPDFTINYNGTEYYWEHLGKLDDTEYAAEWKIKEIWYNSNFPGKLITTNEITDIGAQIKEIMHSKFSFNLCPQGS